MLTATKPHAKFFGRKAAPCRRCGGASHYLNSMGGVACLTCSPPRSEADVRGKLTIECGVWVDPEDRFSMVGEPTAVASVTSPDRPQTRPAASSNTTGNRPVNNQVNRVNTLSLSEAELEFLTSDVVWNSGDQWISLKSSSHSRALAGTRTLEWLSPNTAGPKGKAKEKNERSSQDDIACGVPYRTELKDKAVAPSQPVYGMAGSPDVKAMLPKTAVKPVTEVIGEIVRVTKRVETFRGPLSPASDYRLMNAWQDRHGAWFVNLADGKTGDLLVTGLSLEGIELV